MILPSAVHAQTAARISIFQGSGQMICDGCPLQGFNEFDSLIVLVSDAVGNPVPNAVVTWVVTQSAGGGTILQSQTVTGIATGSSATPCTAVGHSCNTFLENTNA